jgi:hypothetical protein
MKPYTNHYVNPLHVDDPEWDPFSRDPFSVPATKFLALVAEEGKYLLVLDRGCQIFSCCDLTPPLFCYS